MMMQVSEPHTSWSGLFLLFFAVPLVFLFIGGTIAMILHPKSRRWGIAVLVTELVLGLFLLIMFGLWGYRSASRDFGGFPQFRQNTSHDGNAANMVDLERAIAGINGQPLPAEGPVAGETAKPAAPSEAAALANNVEEINKTLGDIEKARNKPPAREKTSGSKRPAWIDAPPGVVGDAYQTAIVVGPYTTRLECDRALPAELRRAAADYVRLCLGDDAKYRWRVRLSDDYLRGNVVKATWEETKETSVGPMTQVHVLLSFDRKTKALVQQQSDNAQAEERIFYAGIGLGAILLVLAATYAVLKIDIATKGTYRKRLALGTGAVGVGLAYASILLSADNPRMDVPDITLFGMLLLLGPGAGLSFPKRTRPFGLALLAAFCLGNLALIVIGDKAW